MNSLPASQNKQQVGPSLSVALPELGAQFIELAKGAWLASGRP